MTHHDAPLMLKKLRQLLLSGTVSTQEEIRLALAAEGVELNQSKISRLLRKLGAIKMTDETGAINYRLPKELLAPSGASPVNQLIVDITHNENVIVIHTVPGSASLIARLIDHHAEKLDVLGSLAGDDTILVLPKSVKLIAAVLDKLNHFLKISTASGRDFP